MTRTSARTRRPAVVAALTGLALAAALVSGCSGGTSTEGDGTIAAPQPVASDGASASDQSPEVPAEEGSDDAGAANSGATVPDGWPEAVLVPAGETLLTTPRGGGWDLLIEGIDESELRSLIDQMTSGGFTSPGVTDMGGGAWIAELTGPVGVVTYSYEAGGAGVPNVRVVFVPSG